MSEIILYTKPNCKLCEETESWLRQLGATWKAVDITADVALYGRYQTRVPVVVLDSYELSAPFSFDGLAAFLNHPGVHKSVARTLPAERNEDGLAFKISAWFARHWLAFINTIIAIYLGLPLLAPVLMVNGLNGPASVIYRVYQFACHQLPQRSYFLFGPQVVYSLQELNELAGTDQLAGYPLYGEYREFAGNEQVGFKVALCQRDIAIYGSMLACGLMFSLVRKRVRPIPLWVYLAVGLGPMALDGGSQLLSYMLPGWMPGGVPRESTWLLRAITGALFGWATMWLALPYLQESFTAIDERLA